MPVSSTEPRLGSSRSPEESTPSKRGRWWARVRLPVAGRSPSGFILFAAATVCVLGGIVALMGYATRHDVLAGLGRSDAPLHPFTAAWFMLLGLYLYACGVSALPRRRLQGAGLALQVVSLTALLLQASGLVTSSPPPPGTIDPFLSGLTAGSQPLTLMLALNLIAFSVILRRNPRPRVRSATIFPLIPVFWVTYFSFTTNFYGAEPFNEHFAYTLLPLPVAFLLGAAATGCLASQPRTGFMAIFNRHYLGGILASIAFPIILLSPFTVGWIRIRMLRSEDHELAASFSQFATTNILVFGTFIWFCARMINRIDARRQRSMHSLRRANEKLIRVNGELQRVNTVLEAKIDEQVRTESARQQTELQLFQSQKMEAMGTLATGIAHDFNNLLTVMLLNAEDALEVAPEGSSLRTSLGEIRMSGLRAAEVIRQIMTFGRKSPGTRSIVDLGMMTKEAAAMLRRGLPRHISLTLSSLDELPPIEADPTQVQQVLINLGTNAAQAMAAHGGNLEIIGKRVTIPSGTMLPHPDLRPGDYACLCVRDEGCGIEEATLKRIFDPFFTTKSPDQGTGLGLSIVHGIMQLHQGSVLVESQPGQGSTFSLYFPVALTGSLPRRQEAA